MPWTLARTGATTITLNSSFNLDSYERATAFTTDTLQGSGVVLNSESIHDDASRLVLTGLIKGDTPDDSRTQLLAIEAVATKDATDLTLANSVTSESYVVQHVRTRARRLGAGILEVSIEFLTNFTRH